MSRDNIASRDKSCFSVARKLGKGLCVERMNSFGVAKVVSLFCLLSVKAGRVTNWPTLAWVSSLQVGGRERGLGREGIWVVVMVVVPYGLRISSNVKKCQTCGGRARTLT